MTGKLKQWGKAAYASSTRKPLEIKNCLLSSSVAPGGRIIARLSSAVCHDVDLERADSAAGALIVKSSTTPSSCSDASSVCPVHMLQLSNIFPENKFHFSVSKCSTRRQHILSCKLTGFYHQ